MDEIYREAENGIERSEYTTVMPISELNFNSPNNYTTFKLDHGDAFYGSNILYHIEGKVVKKSDGSEYPAQTALKLVDNFAAFLFSRIELKKHNTLIESVDNPGITSMIKGLVSYENANKAQLESNGFISKFTTGKFEALGTLGHLGMGFFDAQNYPIYKGGFEITFTRAEDNDAVFHWASTGSAQPSDAQIKITSFVLRVPLIEYSDIKRSQLISGLKKLSDKDGLIYNYFQWQCIDKKGVYGSSFSFDITSLYRNVQNPRFVIIGLQTNRTNDQTKDPSQFDSCKIKNVAVKINGHRYPYEMQNMDIDNNRYRILYDQYTAFRKLMYGDANVTLDIETFINKYPLMVIDTHYHPKTTDKSRNDIQVEMDFVSPLAAPTATSTTVAYVVVVSESHILYDVSKNFIRFFGGY